MAKFIFNLENILQLKVKLEEQRKIELGNAMQSLATQEWVLQQMEESLEALLQEFIQLSSQPTKPKQYIQLNKSIRYVEDEIVKQKVVLENEKKRVEQARAQLNLAVQEKKIYEKLKEIAYEEYLLQEKQEEHLLLDEINSYKYSQ